MLARFFKLILLSTVIVGLGWYLFWRNQVSQTQLDSLVVDRSLIASPIKQLTKVLNVHALPPSLNQESFATTIDRGVESVGRLESFIQGWVKVDESKGENLVDKAVKYSTYVYCKQVVDGWEKAEN